MAVVIQRMVNADVAGVAFSVDPVSGNLAHVLLEGNWGLGKSVVAGEASTDSWVVDECKIVERRICEKTFKYVPADKGIVRRDIPLEEQSIPCLSDEQLFIISQKARDLMEIYAAPQDMEWVMEKGTLYIVQSRPQTTIPPRFTRDESAERFPDPLTPLTWSYVQETFNNSLEFSLNLMNIHLPTRPWFDLKNHYVYGNQNAVKLLAFYKPVQARNFHELIDEIPELRKKYSWVMDLPQLWLRDLDQYLLKIGELNSINLNTLDCNGFHEYLNKTFSVVNDYFKPNIAISMTQTFLTRTLFTVIGQLIDNPLEANDLLKKIISTPETKTGQINREIFFLAQIAITEPQLMKHLEKGGKSALGHIKDFETFFKKFQNFIENYGHREISFDYYYPTWSDAPEVVLDLIYLTASSSRRGMFAAACLFYQMEIVFMLTAGRGLLDVFES